MPRRSAVPRRRPCCAQCFAHPSRDPAILRGCASAATMRRGGGQHNARRGPKPPPAAASAAPTFASLADEAYQLSERAERRRGEQADELLAQCIALYQQALVLNPQHLDTRYNLCVLSYFFCSLPHAWALISLSAHAMYSRAKVTKSQDVRVHIYHNFLTLRESLPSRALRSLSHLSPARP